MKKIPLLTQLCLALFSVGTCSGETESYMHMTFDEGEGEYLHDRNTDSEHRRDEMFSYFETPQGDDVGNVGPSVWRDLDNIQHNQCGGYGQKDGFGQSPIIFPFEKFKAKCDGDRSGYTFEASTCTFEELVYNSKKDGLYVTTPPDHQCHMGSATIPGDTEHVWYAREMRLILGSEHSVEEFTSEAEMQIFYDSKESDKVVAFSIPLSVRGGEQALDEIDWRFEPREARNDFISTLLNGWGAEKDRKAKFCTDNPNGSDEFNVNSVLTKEQILVDCLSPDDDRMDYWTKVLSNNTKLQVSVSDTDAPEVTFWQEFLQGPVPNLFEPGTLLPDDTYGFLAYKGSLTIPPCTEKVYWNFADHGVHIAQSQLARLTMLLLCHVEESTCQFGSVASEFGKTTRPPQPRNDRGIIHYCGGHNSSDIPSVSYVKPTAPLIKKYKKPKEAKPYYAILFPWFAIALGVVVYYLTTRFLHLFPYTAILWLIGTMMGIIIMFTGGHNHLRDAALMCENINSEVLLIVFLPGLLFKDAYGLDIHLFLKSFGQILLMAFPMVLAGTTLMALVGYYILPYDWNFNFCMTFGAILSATDPVAVSALLNELGAPPRLKMHISGESLFNDGSAIVFFVIFKTLFLYDAGLHGGEEIGWGEGIAMFFKMSAGAAAMGTAFGLALVLILWLLHRKHNKEEAIIQVCATIAVAYLTFYVSEAVYHMSGVIAVVCCGIITKAMAPTILIDQDMMEKFWNLVEHLLNTVLFVLGGLVWGSVISNRDERRPYTFDGKDWGYLLLVYVLMSAIRLFLFGAFFPIISRIGLKSNWKEMVFQSFGGLRGAVGIALAISLDNYVANDTVRIDPRRALTSQLFGITGGISLLTLFINGTLAGPLLKKLELGRASPEREKVTKRYEQHLKRHSLMHLVKLLGEPRFQHLDFKIIQRYVKPLEVICCAELKAAVRRLRDGMPHHLYQEPDLSMFEKHFQDEQEEFAKVKACAKVKLIDHFKSAVIRAAIELPVDGLSEQAMEKAVSPEELVELRMVFVELLRRAYDEDTKRGEIDSNFGWVVFDLSGSVAVLEDHVTNGFPINDWVAASQTKRRRTAKLCLKQDKYVLYDVLLSLFFINAHREAREAFLYKFCDEAALTATEQEVLKENDKQVALAQESLNAHDPEVVKKIASFLLCSTLLNNAAVKVAEFADAGLLKDAEAEHWIEHLEHDIKALNNGVLSLNWMPEMPSSFTYES